MNFDCIIIGSGIAGLTCALKLANEGLSCAIISSGVSSLHYSSGSIDLLGYYPEKKVVSSPFDALKMLINDNRKHPYAKIGIDNIEKGLSFFQKEALENRLVLFANRGNNHFHVTPLGTLKPTYLSQTSVFNEKIADYFSRKQKIAILNIDGFRDFHPSITASNLKKHELFREIDIVTGTIRLPDADKKLKNRHDFRSIDISRIFDSGQSIDKIASQIKSTAGDARIVAIPAFLGIENYNETINKLNELTGKLIYELPSLPPSILGMRLDIVLKSRFTELGGVLINDRVIAGNISAGQLKCIYTENHKERELSARLYVISSGSFFTGGLVSESDAVREPIFDLEVDHTPGRRTWRSKNFLKVSQPFIRFGVRTNERLNPFDRSGKTIENLFCTGAILSNYDPIIEGTGCGVAIGTGYYAATEIGECFKGSTIPKAEDIITRSKKLYTREREFIIEQGKNSI